MANADMDTPAESSGATLPVDARPSGRARPPLDPLVRDYADWRARSLRLSCLALLSLYALSISSGDAFPAVRFGLRHPSSMEKGLEGGLNGYLRLISVAHVLLLLASTLLRDRLRWSSLLARSAWALAFFGPLPLFLIPFSTILEQRGGNAAILAAKAIQGILHFYIPPLFALLPALIRASVVLKRFLPEAALPGVLIILAAPLLAVAYLLLICIVMQVLPHRDLVLGFLSLALAPMVWLARAGSLLRPAGREGGGDSFRLERLASNGFTLLGSSLILREASADVDLDWLGAPAIDVRWTLRFMAGILASRALLTVTLVDGLLSILSRAFQAERAAMPAGTAERLGRKVRSLGTALGHPESPTARTGV